MGPSPPPVGTASGLTLARLAGGIASVAGGLLSGFALGFFLGALLGLELLARNPIGCLRNLTLGLLALFFRLLLRPPGVLGAKFHGSRLLGRPPSLHLWIVGLGLGFHLLEQGTFGLSRLLKPVGHLLIFEFSHGFRCLVWKSRPTAITAVYRRSSGEWYYRLQKRETSKTRGSLCKFVLSNAPLRCRMATLDRLLTPPLGSRSNLATDSGHIHLKLNSSRGREYPSRRSMRHCHRRQTHA